MVHDQNAGTDSFSGVRSSTGQRDNQQGAHTTVTTKFPGQFGPMQPVGPNPFGPQSAPSQGAAPSGKDRLEKLVAIIGETGVSDQHDLAQLCEAVRALEHYVAVNLMMSAAELQAGAKQMDKRRGLISGFTASRRMKKVTKAMTAAASSAADAAGQIISAYSIFEKEFEADLEGRKAKQRRGFDIT